MFNSDWDQTRDLYKSWVSNWHIESGLNEILRFRDYPLWHSSRLILKDTIVDYAWYKEIHNRLSFKPISKFRLLADFTIYTALVLNSFRYILFYILLKFIPSNRATLAERTVWFSCLDYNLIDRPIVGFCDRHYVGTPFLGTQFNFNSAYLIRLSLPRFKEILFPWVYINRVNSIIDRSKLDVHFLDKNLRLRDVLAVFSGLLFNYYKFTLFRSNYHKHRALIKGIEITDVVYHEIQASFVNNFPWALLTACMYNNWGVSVEKPQTVITYSETLAPFRATYFFTRKSSSQILWISIQHSINYLNKLMMCPDSSEFNFPNTLGTEVSLLLPDYYFIHGKFFYDILSSFFPLQHIRVIGCLKNDLLFSLQRKTNSIGFSTVSSRILLIVPSIGDEYRLLNLFSGIHYLPGWSVLLSKHPASSYEFLDIVKNNCNVLIPIEFCNHKSTIELALESDLVLSSYSSVGIESLLLGVQSLRCIDPSLPPLIDAEPGIPYISTQPEFINFLSSFNSDPGLTVLQKATIYNYFYKFDGLAGFRFWKELMLLIN